MASLTKINFSIFENIKAKFFTYGYLFSKREFKKFNYKIYFQP